jgi:integrase
LRKNPVVSRVVKFDREKSRDRTLEDEEFVSLLRACSGRLLSIVLVALNTGMRLGEILSLKWENVNLDKRKIEIKHTKNGEDRIIPMNTFLDDLFKLMPREQVYLFVNRDGVKMGSIKTAWNNATEKAGIKDFRFHDLRHTVASRLSRARIPESMIAMILGHKRTSITSRYINPHWEEMVEAVAALGRLCHVFVAESQKS